MKRVLLLCFIHGFKGDDDTFQHFPDDLNQTLSSNLGGDHIESIVYPKYETKGELAETTAAFLEWSVTCASIHGDDNANTGWQAEGTGNGSQESPRRNSMAA